MQQRYEADFRFNLVRTRENSEQIALLQGEQAESARHQFRFASIVRNWRLIMNKQKQLTFLTAGYSQVSSVFPFIVVSPAYFAGAVQLGGLMQTASAFSSVQGALSYFVTAYRYLAEWRAVVERLAGFERSIAAAEALALAKPAITLVPRKERTIHVADLALKLPNGVPLVNASDLTIAVHDRVLVSGPSGSGKSTLFRALAGIWPFGTGTIEVPKDAKVMMLPQRPYFPVAPLGAAIVYPAEPGEFSGTEIAEVLSAVGLSGLTGRIEEEAHWNRMLSLGEQQRLGLARALLHKPDYLFLDEATASVDEAAEAALYKLLQARLPDCTIVSIGHRSTLAAFHTRRVAFERSGDHYQLKERQLAPAE
jgi:putative ATP-binding cassette transporter